MINAFTVDLETWFSNFHNNIPISDWDRTPHRVIEPTVKILDLLESRGMKGTFFVLGWVAEQVPDLIKEIHDRGNEVAVHSYHHKYLTESNEDELRKDLDLAFSAIYKAVSCKIYGYRAPVFTITRETLWALDVLKEYGFKYDSSIYPFNLHPDYGIKDHPLSIYKHDNGLIEVPMSCVEYMGKRIPVSGGGYFRLYPYRFYKKFVRKVHKEGRPLIFYTHPWEIDTKHPRVKLGLVERFRHYQNLEKTENKLGLLLNDFKFTTIKDILIRDGYLKEEQQEQSS